MVPSFYLSCDFHIGLIVQWCWVRSDGSIQTSWLKEAYFESLKKLLEKQRNGTQKPQQSSYLECNAISCHFMKFHSISAFDATFCNNFHQSMPSQCKHRQDDFNVCTRVFCSKTILYYWYTKVMVWLLVVWSVF